MRKKPLIGIFLICIFFMSIMQGLIHPVNATDQYTQPTLLWKSTSLNKIVVADVAISSNGQYTLVGTLSHDKYVYLLDRYGKLIWKNNTGAGIANVAITPDGKYSVASAGNKSWFLIHTQEPAENNVYLYDREGNLLWKYNTGECMGLTAISADGQYIVFGDGGWSDTSVTLLNHEKSVLWKYDTDQNIKAVAISSDGQYIVVGLTDGTILLLNHEGRQLWKYNTMGITRMGIAISADDQHIAISEQSTKGAIIHHLNKNGQLIWKYNTDVGMLDIAISPDGNYIAAGSSDLYLFDHTGILFGRYVTGTGGVLKKIVVSSNDLNVAMGNWDGSVSMYSSESHDIIPETSIPTTPTLTATPSMPVTSPTISSQPTPTKTLPAATQTPIPAPLVAAFEATPVYGGPTPFTVTFTDMSTGSGITSRVWQYKPNTGIFAVGSTFIPWTTFTPDPTDKTFTFNADGSYDIKLTLSGSGGTAEEVKYKYINIGCDFSTQPGIERCYGGIGRQCDGTPLYPFINQERTCKIDGWVSVGSIGHDRCCRNINNAGWSCLIPYTGDSNYCKDEWDEAVANTFCTKIGADRQCGYSFGPYPMGNTGDETFVDEDSQTQILKGIRAPSGARVNPKYQYLCQSGKCKTDENQDPIRRTDFSLCGEYCICE